MSKQMTLELFQSLVASYGADFSKWPMENRASAIVFAAGHVQELSGDMEIENRLDDWLACVPKPTTNVALTSKIIQSFSPFEVQERFSLSSFIILVFGSRPHARSMAMASAAFLALCGAVGGYAGSDFLVGIEPSTEIISQAFADGAFSLGNEVET